jgi:hypothetical protein
MKINIEGQRKRRRNPKTGDIFTFEGTYGTEIRQIVSFDGKYGALVVHTNKSTLTVGEVCHVGMNNPNSVVKFYSKVNQLEWYKQVGIDLKRTEEDILV